MSLKSLKKGYGKGNLEELGYQNLISCCIKRLIVKENYLCNIFAVLL